MMKRYRFGIDFNTEYIVVPAVHEHKEGEWVEADIAVEMYRVLDKALHLLKTGKEEINDDTGDSELTLTSGDFWVSTMNDIERVLRKARGEGE